MKVSSTTVSGQYVPYRYIGAALPAHCGTSNTAHSTNDQAWDEVYQGGTSDTQTGGASATLILVPRVNPPIQDV